MNWKETFVWNGKSLPYNRIFYNNWAERCVEIPIVFDWLINLPTKQKILEIGNVLTHYENRLSDYFGIRPRHIIDKFEIAPGVENVDLMDLPPEAKYDCILCISTVEHVNQGYAGNVEDHHLEAPLGAIAKIYDTLAVGGKALVTVPFGKLLDGGWYVQFSLPYLNLLSEKYGIPEVAIAPSFFKRITSELAEENPRQLWLQTSPEELEDVDYGFPWCYGNGISVIELTKVSDDFVLKLDVPNTELTYHKPVLETMGESLIDATLPVLLDLRDVNFICFPDWSAPEAELSAELGQVIRSVVTHPDRACLTIAIDITGVSEEDATLVISGIVMDLIASESLETPDEPGITLVNNFIPVQWQVLLPRMQARIVMKTENQTAIEKAFASDLLTYKPEDLEKRRAIALETGLWKFESV